ncbi:DUF4238 domain-containing protein [Plesiomonas shigelloides]|uniref:DUF4238 domain-containing protein n=1 Tax=Plesiomonas shigelloides TaxID=703 RepID=UPI00351CCFA9
MEKWQQIKKKHHYVWEYYLKNWSKNGRVYWLTPKGKVANDSTKGLCRANEIYKISSLTNDDVNFLLRFSERSVLECQATHKALIKQYFDISKVINKIDEFDVYDERLDLVRNVLLFNPLENHYTAVESLARAPIDALSMGDNSILNDAQSVMALSGYIANQLMRTKKIKDRILDSIFSYNDFKVEFEEVVRQFEKNWWILSLIFSCNVAYSLRASSARMLLIENKSTTPFITSDAPVVNIHPEYQANIGALPIYDDLLFPISPDYVLILPSSDTWCGLKDGADTDAVELLNRYTAQNAHISIFGSDEKTVIDNKGYLIR